MPIPKYGVLIGRAADRRFATQTSNHYELKVIAIDSPFRIAINTQSQDGSEVLYAVKPAFQHPMLAALGTLADGYHAIPSQPAGIAIDFVKGENFVATR